MSSSVTSAEGFYFALILADNTLMYQWGYGKIRVKQMRQLENGYYIYITNQSATCVANIDSRQCWVTEECRSQLGKEYIESLGVKNYFSMAYEQHQNSPADSSITSSQMAGSG